VIVPRDPLGWTPPPTAERSLIAAVDLRRLDKTGCCCLCCFASRTPAAARSVPQPQQPAAWTVTGGATGVPSGLSASDEAVFIAAVAVMASSPCGFGAGCKSSRCGSAAGEQTRAMLRVAKWVRVEIVELPRFPTLRDVCDRCDSRPLDLKDQVP
jgi:hypothetical protein